jgi:hypothetical protein
MAGDAFNRGEVASVYVGPKDRWVVSLVAGIGRLAASTPEEACAAVLRMVRGPESGRTVWCAHDRETGETAEVEQSAFDPDPPPEE